MSRAYTSYTTIRCGNRKIAERIELIFTMETDSPVLDGIMGVQIRAENGSLRVTHDPSDPLSS